MNDRRLFIHARLVSPGLELNDCALAVENGRVAGVYPAGTPPPAADRVRDLGGRLLLPGFVDIHTHGAAGVDFCDGTEAAVRVLARHKLSQGVTTFLGTTLTLPEDVLAAALDAARAYAAAPDGALLAGIHLEGPFLAPDFAGAQNPAHLAAPDIGLVDRLSARYPLRIVSYSPELDPARGFAHALAARGIIPAAAHTGADYATFRDAVAAGLRHLSHFANLMTPLHHLRFGMVGGALLHDDTMLEIIADGVHLCPEMIRLLFKVAGPDRLMLVTDSMRAAGMPDGEYSLGGLPARVAGGIARLDNGAVAGSTLLFHQGLRRVRDITGLPLCQLVKAAGYNQARSLGLTDLGALTPGFRAHMVALSDGLEPQEVWIDGESAWTAAA